MGGAGQTLQQPSKSTQRRVCASEQMAGLVAVKTMGRASTHSHIPLVHFTHMVNAKFNIVKEQR